MDPSRSDLEWRIVHNPINATPAPRVRWRCVKDATAYGSTTSYKMCVYHGVDPDDMIKPAIDDLYSDEVQDWKDEAQRLSDLGLKAQVIMRQQREEIRKLRAKTAPLGSILDMLKGK